MFRASKTHFLVRSRHWGDFSFYVYSFSFFDLCFVLVDKQHNFFVFTGLQMRIYFFFKKKKIALEYYVILIGKLRRFSSLTGLNCFRKVVSKSAIRTPLHSANSASKSLKSQRWISRDSNILLIEVFTLLEEASPIKCFGRGCFLVCTWQISTTNGIIYLFMTKGENTAHEKIL